MEVLLLSPLETVAAPFTDSHCLLCSVPSNPQALSPDHPRRPRTRILPPSFPRRHSNRHPPLNPLLCGCHTRNRQGTNQRLHGCCDCPLNISVVNAIAAAVGLSFDLKG